MIMRMKHMLRLWGTVSVLAVMSAGLASVFASEKMAERPAGGKSAHSEARAETGAADAAIAGLDAGEGALTLETLLLLAADHERAANADELSAKACKAYIALTLRFSKLDRFHPDSGQLADAFRKAADCYFAGIGTPDGQKDATAAGNLLFHSGVVLEDAESLFNLGKLFMTADGIGPNMGLATRFLESAARKQYPPAQALLGSMMWEGKVTKHRPAVGLALLMLGNERTESKDRAWITSLYDEAMITASKDVEGEARQLVEKWRALHKDASGGTAQLATMAVPSPEKSPARADGGLAVAGDDLTGKTTESHKPASAEAVPNQ